MRAPFQNGIEGLRKKKEICFKSKYLLFETLCSYKSKPEDWECLSRQIENRSGVGEEGEGGGEGWSFSKATVG